MNRVSFKDGVDPTDIFRFTKNCQILFIEVMKYFESKNIPLVITSLISDRKNIKTISSTHEEGRAFDVRTRGIEAIYLEKVEKYFNFNFKNLAPYSIQTGELRCAVLKGDHIHFQVAR